MAAEGPFNAKEVLEEIRENFKYGVERWQPIREDGREDMRYVAGDPWDPKERKARKDNNRQCLTFDETNQYTNQLINGVRENKRGIRVIPKGGGATEKTAEYRAGRIREIEFRSNAQAAYLTAFEGGVQRGYGFFAVRTRFKAPQGEIPTAAWFDQEIVVSPVPNPDTVVLDPDYKEADAADIGWAFITDLIRRKLYKQKFPGAEIVDFDSAHELQAPLWITGENVQIAEYWKVKKKSRTLLLTDKQGTPRFLDEFRGAKLVSAEGHSFLRVEGNPNIPILRSRKVDISEVCQFLTNGVEILEYTPWPGKIIPIVGIFGKELYIDEGSGARRVLMSLVRLARDAQMLLNYYRTCEAEIVGQVPKTPFIGYEGQFEGHEKEWQSVNQVPVPYLEAKGMADATGGAVLPLPQRQIFEPPIQAMEMGAEAARQAIRAAMMGSPLPTPAQRLNEKSGVALERIESSSQRGSFHFVDNYDRGLKKAGRIINDILDDVEDTERDVGLVRADDTYEVTRLTLDPETGKPANGRGEHDVDITTGPDFASQREEAGTFVEVLVGNIEKLPVPPEVKAKLMGLLVKLKNLGPIGDQVAQILTPPEMTGQDGKPLPPEAQQAILASQQKLKALNAYAQQLEQMVQKLEQEKESKELEIASRERVEIKRLELESAKIESQEAIAVLKAEVDAIKAGMQADTQRMARQAEAGAEAIQSGN